MRHRNKKHRKEAVVTEETKPQAEAPLAAPPPAPVAEEKPASVVDTVFDRVTDWTVTGLRGTQRGLEVGARWLDARAKQVGDLAQKLGETEAADQPKAA